MRTAVFILPLVLAAETDLLWSRRYPPPTELQQMLVWLAEIFLISAVVLGVTRWIARRLLPLAALLNVSLAFPDAAPSRREVARQRPRAADLEREATRAYVLGETEDPADRAETVLILARALSAHDERARAHTERVRLLAQMLGEKMQLIRDDRDRLNWAAVLHDIGKLTIAPAILNKPGKLNEEEWEIIRQHPEVGARLARSMLPWLGDELGRAVEQHHEHYDGSGYPKGLEGGELSRLGRALAVVDSFEVMTAARPGHAPMTVGAARKELDRCSGTQFDPAVVRSFDRIPTARIYLALGPMSVISLFPGIRGLPGTLGRALAPIANVAVAVVAAALVLGAMTGSGALRQVTGPPPPPVLRPVGPVALTTAGTFGNYFAPFTTSHVVAVKKACALGIAVDTAHVYVSGCDGTIIRVPLSGQSPTQPPFARTVGADSSLLIDRGHYYFAARGTAPGVIGIFTFDPGTLLPGPKVVDTAGVLGTAADPLGDSIFAVGAAGLYRVDNLLGVRSVSLIAAGTFDGAAVSPNGSTVYVPSGQSVVGFDRSGHKVATIDVCCHNPDGLVVLRSGTRAGAVDMSGSILVNANDGSLLRIDTTHGNLVSVVASGGQRGDFMTLGPDGCIYASQGNSVVRMDPCLTAASG
jgi:putative nucleotidyltransferase with HDIG domain